MTIWQTIKAYIGLSIIWLLCKLHIWNESDFD
jgi:hypothetical protein